MSANLSWKVTGTRHVLRDRWISVRADDCVTPAGVVISPFYVLEYADWVHVLAIDRLDHIVLVRQYRHGFGGDTLELPGGMMDAKDAGPVAAGLRELQEETGYISAKGELVASLSPNPATHTNRLHLVLARDVEPSGTFGNEDAEDTVVRRVSCAEAMELALAGEVVHAAHLGLLMLGLRAAGKLSFGVNCGLGVVS